MGDRKQPFAAVVFETLARRSTELGRWWAERARLPDPEDLSEPDNNGDDPSATGVAERLIRTLVDAAVLDGAHRDALVRAGCSMGAASHRRSASLHKTLKELDLLAAALLRAAERASSEQAAATASEGIAVARRIIGAMSLLRLATITGYTQAAEDELRERFRAIRHDLRNPLGTIKSAVALLTDESVPTETRHNPRVRAMVARNARSLEQLIGEVLGDDAARLHAFGIPQEPPADSLVDSPTDVPADSAVSSRRKQRDDIPRVRQRPDLESGTF